ncbi:AmpD protein [Orbus hercynius]|uniref:1,6-anhydro-N-acetylmuramyl-L-alanine amidase AmpD n=1 Tax=Orbus hercynius TaxID=593135 RepID=A0A495RHV6_9GAMM|nr:1,6-anhydro-N-acetylmuramyl-L-alanine amidase AmpD [Orbus hercynius]RKS86844.1 AmpD protein [Orbus hercynius]
MYSKIQQGFLAGVKFVPSPYFNDRPIGEMISLLVIHNISLPPNQFGGDYVEQLFTGRLDPSEHEYFQTIYQLQVSSHLFIRRNGHVTQFVSFDKRAWHAGQSQFDGHDNCNNYSIGIELEGCDFEPFTLSQYSTLVEITQLLKQYYPIKHVVGHSDIAPSRKTDPGPFFDWPLYRSLIT